MIARTLAAEGKRVAVFKPAVTGLDEAPARPDHELLRRAAGSGQSDEEIAPYRYGPPASPHLAAALAGEEIDPGRLRSAAARAAREPTRSSARGSAACWCPSPPATSSATSPPISATRWWSPPRPGLGTINHTLLTIEAARAAGLEVAAVVLTPGRRTRPRSSAPTARRSPPSAGSRSRPCPQLDLGEPETWPPLRI